MLTRRRFLGHLAVGTLTLTGGGCTPPNLSKFHQPDPARAGASPSPAPPTRTASPKSLLLGYPINMATPPREFFEWRARLAQSGIGQFAYNNVGNPFEPSPIPYNTHDIERRVILDFARLYAFPPDDAWGFVSHSGTDSNLHGLYMGRTILKGGTGMTPKVYFTLEAHYSIQILQDLLGLDRILVGTTPDGAMDPEDLRRRLRENAGHPALVVATLGTTFKGAIDPVDAIQEVLRNHPGYLHLDAALFGGYLPYTSHAGHVAQRNSDATRYDSIAVSCHKFFGFPAPAGLFIARASRFREFQREFSRVHNPEYLHHVPGTITCSRDSVKPAEFQYFTTVPARTRLTEAARGILERTDWFHDRLQGEFPQLRPIRANALSNTVYFRKPGRDIVKKYTLATMRLARDGNGEKHAHVVVMPHASRAVLMEFLGDLRKEVGA